jgi:hypothetical protein
MPWQETLLMDQRVQFIADYQRDVFDLAELARRFGISRKTANGMTPEGSRTGRSVAAASPLSARTAGDIPALVAMLKDRDKKLKQLDARLAPRETPDRERLRLALEQRVDEWRGILRERPPGADGVATAHRADARFTRTRTVRGG